MEQKGPYITPKEMKILDINSKYFGVPVLKLMEAAGRGVFEVIGERMTPKNKDVLIFCGTGNNGGDGFVAARYLAEGGANVKVVLIGREGEIRTSEARENWKRIREMRRVAIEIFEGLSNINFDSDIIIDAILGTGVKGELREPISSIVGEINKTKAFKVSVDIPTGLGEKTVKGRNIKADLVVTFHKMKKGLENFNYVVKDIGIPKEAETQVGPGDVIANLRRRSDSHKGENGRVLVVGGSDLYYGAPILTGLSAINSGADLVYLAVPEGNLEISRAFSLDLIVRAYPGGYLNPGGADVVLELATQCDSLVIGPGLGIRKETSEAVLKILREVEVPVVIDADGIKSIKEEPGILKKIDAVLTPHPREFKILTGEDLSKDIDERKRLVLNFAEKLGSVILLKSPVDIIASPDGRVKINTTGNPGMTVGGTGDALSGLLGSFLAQDMGSFEAACCAAFINGWSGDNLYELKGNAFTASDLVEEIPFALKDVLDFEEE
ncbi:MAG: NAD(P)H-hydrate dehydratase [Candidatus Hydrothermarchaeales archaeon]